LNDIPYSKDATNTLATNRNPCPQNTKQNPTKIMEMFFA